jgi:hypothetical protein
MKNLKGIDDRWDTIQAITKHLKMDQTCPTPTLYENQGLMVCHGLLQLSTKIIRQPWCFPKQPTHQTFT